MQRFKSIIMPMHGHSKRELYWLYNTKFNMDSNYGDFENIFEYSSLKFWFEGTGPRNTEKLNLYVEIALNNININQRYVTIYEYVLLDRLSRVINELSRDYINQDKSIREKAQFSAQSTDERVLKRSGMFYNKKKDKFIFKINFNVPLLNAISVNAKATVQAIKDIMKHIEDIIKTIDEKELKPFIAVYEKQIEIRKYLKENNLCVFIADGSILPRENGTNLPLKNATPFFAPSNMCIQIPFSDGTKISGMAIKHGVTVITGGAYSGKSTLLDAIEMGIYNHVLGDGREYVITDDRALKVYVEDGRPVHNLDISPFFNYLPNNDVKDFSTAHASGSVSQAANVVEALCGGAKLLLLDEDKSATNFMIRDTNMRKIVEHEPIIPFTDRIRELYSGSGVSTILVIGGSSEYLHHADKVILMDNYSVKDITQEIREICWPVYNMRVETAHFVELRYLIPPRENQPFLYFHTVETENEKKIIIDEYNVDITLLTAIISTPQVNSITYALLLLLQDINSDESDMLSRIKKLLSNLFNEEQYVYSSVSIASEKWYEEIRPLDVFYCICRMKGIELKGDKN